MEGRDIPAPTLPAVTQVTAREVTIVDRPGPHRRKSASLCRGGTDD